MNTKINDRLNLDEPHFDEEATILAARPVVPLDEVKAETRSRGRVALTLAICGGLLIGLLGATFLFRYLGSTKQPTEETIAVAEPPANRADEPPNQLRNAAGGAIGVADSARTVEEEQPEVADNDDAQPEREVEESKPVRPESRVPEVAPRRPSVVIRESRPPVRDEEEDRDSRRLQRQEERRERRRAVREARRQQGRDGNDDLSRIREIFEGSPKP